MKKRLWGVLLTAAMVMSAAAGCSEAGGGSGGGQTQAAGSTATAGQSESTGAADSAAQTASQAAADVDTQLASGDVNKADLKVTALFYSLEGEYFSILDTLLEENITGYGYQYESQSSNNDSLAMIEQIENAVAGGTDCIWIWTLNGPTVADALASAKAQGVKVLAFVADPGPDARDVFRGSDSVYSGECISEMAIEWADEVYGADAEAGSINTILIGTTSQTEMKERLEGMESKIKTDPRFNILEVVDNESSTVAAQQVTENMFNKYGDIDCFITSGGELALGVIGYTTSPGSPVEDHQKFGIFGTEINEELASYMEQDIYDGSVVNGGRIDDNIKVMAEIIDGLLTGKEMDAEIPVDMGLLTKDQLADYGY